MYLHLFRSLQILTCFYLVVVFAETVELFEQQCYSDEHITSQLLSPSEVDAATSLSVRPSEVVNVEIEIATHAIILLNHKDSTLTMDAYVTLHWTDVRLKFDQIPACSSNIRLEKQISSVIKSFVKCTGVSIPYLHLNLKPANMKVRCSILIQKHIWVPVVNFHGAQEAALLSLPSANMFAWLEANGRMKFQQKMRFKIPCKINLDRYPMDTAHCGLVFSSIEYDDSKVRLSWRKSDPIQIWLNRNTEEHLLAKTATDYSVYEHLGVNYTELYGEFILRRRFSWYILQAYVPSGLVVTVNWLHCTLRPSNALPRLQISSALMLAVIVLFFNILQNVPRVGYVKALDIWLIACIIFLITSVAETTIVALLSRLADDQKERRKQRALDLQTKVPFVNGSHSGQKVTADSDAQLCRNRSNRSPSSHAASKGPTAVPPTASHNYNQLLDEDPQFGYRPKQSREFSPMIACANADNHHGNSTSLVREKPDFRRWALILDNVFITIFPVGFVTFVTVYWVYFLFLYR